MQHPSGEIVACLGGLHAGRRHICYGRRWEIESLLHHWILAWSDHNTEHLLPYIVELHEHAASQRGDCSVIGAAACFQAAFFSLLPVTLAYPTLVSEPELQRRTFPGWQLYTPRLMTLVLFSCWLMSC